MLRLSKSKSWMTAVFTLVILGLVTSGFSRVLRSGRIMPMGKVTVYRGDQKTGEFRAEAPFPEGALLACDGKCAVKMEDLYLVAEDKSKFSVVTNSDARELQVNEGTVYFALSRLPKAMVFTTPSAVLRTEEVILNVSANGSLLRGYVKVAPGTTELGVIDGGSMLVSTFEGKKRIRAGRQITVVEAKTVKGSSGAAAATASNVKTAWRPSSKISYKRLVVGGIALPVIAGAALALAGGGGGSGSHSTASPSSPPSP